MPKTCFKCGTVKSLTQFYRHPMMADGRLNKCKECTRKDTRQTQNRMKCDPNYKKSRSVDRGKREPRFWSKVDQSNGENACWLWTGHRGTNGYGTARFEGLSTRQAHRIAYMLHHGVELRLLVHVCHDCPGGDNRLCCNPKHLWIGTNADNVADKVRKGRQTFGSTAGRAKLTESKVRTVWKLLGRGWTTTRVASRYQVSSRTIQAIARGESWKHVVPDKGKS